MFVTVCFGMNFSEIAVLRIFVGRAYIHTIIHVKYVHLYIFSSFCWFGVFPIGCRSYLFVKHQQSIAFFSDVRQKVVKPENLKQREGAGSTANNL